MNRRQALKGLLKAGAERMLEYFLKKAPRSSEGQAFFILMEAAARDLGA
jgi:hypothetical protein